ncbi:MAG: ubiquinone/menaquinone biosynthesis methyltransferase [candidate division NC10 bacterium]|nr:ubiquinone/menaquinone biosynthesis methyltransferase [candidate division NC10 bacterium]
MRKARVVSGQANPLRRFHADGVAKAAFVRAGFFAIAKQYDRLTRVFSFGLDGRWRRSVIELCGLHPGDRLLDIATGTGELALAAGRRVAPAGLVAGLDFCQPMLEEGRRKGQDQRGSHLAWVLGKAEELPFHQETFDCVTMGFALRHVLDVRATLREMARVIRPGGRVVVLEFTRPERRSLKALYYLYLFGLLPGLVWLASRDRQIYTLTRYFPRTIRHFLPRERLAAAFAGAGFGGVEIRPLAGGVVSVIAARKRVRVRAFRRETDRRGRGLGPREGAPGLLA